MTVRRPRFVILAALAVITVTGCASGTRARTAPAQATGPPTTVTAGYLAGVAGANRLGDDITTAVNLVVTDPSSPSYHDPLTLYTRCVSAGGPDFTCQLTRSSGQVTALPIHVAPDGTWDVAPAGPAISPDGKSFVTTPGGSLIINP